MSIVPIKTQLTDSVESKIVSLTYRLYSQFDSNVIAFRNLFRIEGRFRIKRQQQWQQ